MIHVEPVRELRREFAVWATAQDPKVMTVSPSAFAVPDGLYVDVPEVLLVGARVDGHRYVSPTEDGARLLACGLCYDEDGEEVHPHPECTVGTTPAPASPDAPPAPLSPDPGPVVSPDASWAVTNPYADEVLREMEAVAGDVLPEVRQSAYAVDSVPLPEPDPDDPNDQAGPDKPEGVFPCGDCEDREFTTAQGLRMHRRQIHATKTEG